MQNNIRPLQNFQSASELVTTGGKFSSCTLLYFVSPNPGSPGMFFTLYQESYWKSREETSITTNFLLKHSDRLTWFNVLCSWSHCFPLGAFKQCNYFPPVFFLKEVKPTSLLLLQLALSLKGRKKKFKKEIIAEEERAAYYFLCPFSLALTNFQQLREKRNSKKLYYHRIIK